MTFFSLILRNVLRRPARSSFTALGLAAAVGATVCLLSIADGLRASLSDRLALADATVLVTRARIAERLTGTLPMNLEAELAAMPEVAQVMPELIDSVSFEDLNLIGVTVYGRSAGELRQGKAELLEGEGLQPAAAPGVLLGTVLAKNLGKRVGDTVKLYDEKPLPVVGIFQSLSLHENAAMIVPLDELQRQLDRRGQVTLFMVKLHETAGEETIDRFRRRVHDLQRGLAVSTTAEYAANDRPLLAAQGLAWLTAVLAATIGSAGVFNTMLAAVVERTREVGILRAIGWSAAAVMRMILVESLLLSVLGAAVGIVAAAMLLTALSHVPASNGLVAGGVPPLVSIQGLGLALGMGLLGSLYPAWHAARILPCEAIRYE